MAISGHATEAMHLHYSSLSSDERPDASPGSLELNREIDLLEIPLLAMDVTLANYMCLAPEESVALLLQCAQRCKTVGGVFTLLWHNRSLLDPNYGGAYETVLEALAFTPAFDWKQALSSGQC